MAIEWTEKQKCAIDRSGCNLIVSAAAGSGKTAVLVERIIRKIINDKTDIDELLITTFTEAAASKMKNDILEAIEKKLEENPSDKHLARQINLINHASISTIHSFCLKVIRSNFQNIDLEPDFRIGDENEIKLLKNEATDEVFEENYESGNENFYELLDAYSTQRGDERLKEIIDKIYGFVVSMPFYEKWMEKQAKSYDIADNFEETIYYKHIKENTTLIIKKNISAFRIACEQAQQCAGLESYESAFLTDMAYLESILYKVQNASVKETSALLAGFTTSTARSKKGADEETKKYLQLVRNEAKKDIAELYKKYYFELDDALIRLKNSMPKVETIFKLVAEIESKFAQMKKQRGIVDFNDLEHYCLKILTVEDENGNYTPSDAAKKLKDKYSEIMIDEYQDANEMQETIFSMISRGNNIFMVGDLKQSIYRFRHTNPMLFKSKTDTYKDGEGINQKVVMAENFRSRQSVIDCVNFIFEQIASPQLGEMVYDKDERLNFAAKYPFEENVNCGGSCELILIDKESEKNFENGYEENEESEENEEEILHGKQAQAMAVCRRIKELMAQGYMVYDKKEGYRNLKLKDIAVLIHSPKTDAQTICEAMEQNHIDCFADVGGGYFDSEEIDVVMNLLSVIDNPRQDIAILALMRSPIFLFDENEMARIRIEDAAGDIYSSVESYAENGSDENLKCKCLEFLQKTERWRQMSVHMPAHELIFTLYKETGYYAYVGAMTNGQVRRANLKLLYKRAENYEKTSYKGLFNFINFAEKMKKASGDSKGARLLGENQDVVRIMSIHKSKGLEFPVVFLVNLDKRFNFKDLKDDVLLHKDYGIGIDYIDCNLRYKCPMIIKNVIKDIARNEKLSEEMRVLYVALTRAKEKLIMVAAPTNLKSAMKKWETVASEAEKLELPVYRCSKAMSYLDWVMPAFLRSESAKDITSSYIATTGSKLDLKISIVNEKAVSEEYAYENEEKEKYENEEELFGILDYSYENEKAKFVPQKLTVTELKRIINTLPDGENYISDNTKLLKMPSFMHSDTKLSGAEKGSVIHYIMQKTDISSKPDKDSIKKIADALFESGFFTKAQRDAVDADMILSFFNSPLGIQMLASNKVVREMPFEMAMPASEVYKNYTGNENILVQGIIDCWFETDDGIILVDYKTDALGVYNTVKSLAAKYENQLLIYKQALKKITKCENIESYIYFFSAGETIKV